MSDTKRETAFRKYDHLERFGHRDVTDINHGLCYVFPKIDGTNGSVWWNAEAEEGNRLACGSRNRLLSKDSDNHGFYAHVQASTELAYTAAAFPNWVFYGEWLVPHSLKTYREEAWRRFYVFDVYDRETDRYVDYETYSKELEHTGLDIIPPLCLIENPTKQDLENVLAMNTYMIKDGEGAGEGIVIKNYQWANFYGRQPWAKMVRNEFKEENNKVFGPAIRKGSFQVEAAIVDEFLTEEMCRKTLHKIILDLGLEFEDGLRQCESTISITHRAKIIPRLIQTVYHDFVIEEIWGALKKHRNPTVDFKTLQGMVTTRLKTLIPELF